MTAITTPTFTLHLGDCREVLATFPDASFDAVVTDPPYGIGFMGREWDTFAPERVERRRAERERKGTDRTSARFPGKIGTVQSGGVNVQYDESASGNARFQMWCAEWAAECLRVLKPGGHLVAFGGARTFHRLTCGIEDAGFEIRDVLTWLQGNGFPKSRNLDGEWKGWGTALKPAWEPIILARKPLAGTVAANVIEYGVGAINIDGCRIGEQGGTRVGVDAAPWRSVNAYGDGFNEKAGDRVPDLGRWPANLLLDESAAAMLDHQTGVTVSHRGAPRSAALPGDGWGMTGTGAEYDDAGGASRFFFVAKTSRAERDAGLDGMDEHPLNWSAGEQSPGTFQSEGTTRLVRNAHPTVKPIALMRWLVRLVTPPGGVVVDPFTGSGSTGCAAVLEGVDFIGIEREAEHLAVAERRIAYWRDSARIEALPLFSGGETP